MRFYELFGLLVVVGLYGFSSLFTPGFPDELQKSKFSTAQDNFGKITDIERTELCLVKSYMGNPSLGLFLDFNEQLCVTLFYSAR